MSKLLIISPVATHPPFGGNSQRIVSIVHALKKLGNDVYFLFQPFSPSKPRNETVAYWGDRFIDGQTLASVPGVHSDMPQICSKSPTQNFPLDTWYPAQLDTVLKALLLEHRFDAVLVEYVVYSKALCQFPTETLRIIDTHDCFSNRYINLSDASTEGIESAQRPTALAWPWGEMSLSKEDEARGLQRADVTIAIQSEEASYFRSLGVSNVVEIGHLIDRVEVPSPRSGKNRLLFVGSIWQPNVDGLRWFIDKVMPPLRQRLPYVELHVVGGVCDNLKPSEGVCLRGRVEDLGTPYREADLVINPVLRGTGQAVKSVEALSYGRPLVTFPSGARGIEGAEGRGISIAHDEQEFMTTIDCLLNDHDEWLRQSCAAAEYIADVNRKYFDRLASIIALHPGGKGRNSAAIDAGREAVTGFHGASFHQRASSQANHKRKSQTHNPKSSSTQEITMPAKTVGEEGSVCEPVGAPKDQTLQPKDSLQPDSETLTRISFLFVPGVRTESDFRDQHYRMAWYFNPMLSYLDRIYVPVHGAAANSFGVIPDYLSPDLTRMAELLSEKITYFDADSLPDWDKAVASSCAMLYWKDSQGTEWFDKRYQQALSNKRCCRVDPETRRHAAFVYCALSSDLNPLSSVDLEESKLKFDAYAQQIDARNYTRSYVLGTGPSLEEALTSSEDFAGGYVVACNSIVKNLPLMERIQPDAFAVADMVFHSGCSSYAHEFRQCLLKAIDLYKVPVFVPMRDYAIYMHNLPSAYRKFIIGVPFTRCGEPFSPDIAPNFNLRTEFSVLTTGNILTIFLMPLATTFAPHVSIVGCDGRKIEENQYFWSHHQTSQFNEQMDAAQQSYPAFFNIDYNDYYLEHCRILEHFLTCGERAGYRFRNLTASYIPALAARQLGKTKPEKAGTDKSSHTTLGPCVPEIEINWRSTVIQQLKKFAAWLKL